MNNILKYTRNILKVPFHFKMKSKPVLSSFSQLDSRPLYSAALLGIDSFSEEAKHVRDDLKAKDNFLNKMQNINSNTNVNMPIYTEDLRNLSALCQEEESLFVLLISLLKKYEYQIQDLNLKPFKFGPVIMRLLHIHNNPEEALKLLKSEEYGKCFHQAASYQIAMDLLFENGRYADVLSLMNDIITQDIIPLPKSCFLLSLAANYKLSSDESLEETKRLLRLATEEGVILPFRGVGFAAGLALNRSQPQVALECLALSKNINHFIINNLYVLAKAQLGHFDEVLDLLRLRTLVDSPKMSKSVTKYIYSAQTVEEIERLCNNQMNLELTNNMKHIKSVLQNMNLISQKSLDESLVEPIKATFTQRHSNFRKSRKPQISEESGFF